jgi:FkbM family methyltransferase
MLEVLINGQWKIKLPEHRAARPEWTAPGGWERARLEHIHSTLKKGDLVYYIGAEEGDMCGLLQMWGAELVMFEPNPAVWPNIKSIWDANDLDDPIAALEAFAGRESKGQLPSFSWPQSCYGKIISDHGFKNLCAADGTIPIVKIDDLPNMVPDMISVDVEGAEWEVLRGAEQTLRKYHPRIYLSLHPEFLYEIYKEYSGDLRYWLKQIGYKETLLDYQHEVHLVYEKEEE